jgi:hypothetical protein
MGVKETGCESKHWIQLDQDGFMGLMSRTCEHATESLTSIKGREFPEVYESVSKSFRTESIKEKKRK